MEDAIMNYFKLFCTKICIGLMLYSCITTNPKFSKSHISDCEIWPCGQMVTLQKNKIDIENLNGMTSMLGITDKLYWISENILILYSNKEDVYLINKRSGVIQIPNENDKQKLMVELVDLFQIREKEKSTGKQVLDGIFSALASGTKIGDTYEEYEKLGKVVNYNSGKFVEFESTIIYKYRNYEANTNYHFVFNNSDDIHSEQTFDISLRYSFSNHWSHVVVSPDGRFLITNNGRIFDCTNTTEKKNELKIWSSYTEMITFAINPEWNKIAFLEFDNNDNLILRIMDFTIPDIL